MLDSPDRPTPPKLNATILSRKPTQTTEPPAGAPKANWTSFPEALGAPPTVAIDEGSFAFRVSGPTPVELDFLDNNGGWIPTKQFGDLIINRLTLGLSSSIILQIRGTTREGELVKISGWYEMNGQTLQFGPGDLGELVEVTIPHNLSCSKPLEYLNFTVVAQPTQGGPYIYDPTLLLVPLDGQCKTNQ